MKNIDLVKVGDLKRLARRLAGSKTSMAYYQSEIGKFAREHALTKQEAFDLAAIAKRCFG